MQRLRDERFSREAANRHTPTMLSKGKERGGCAGRAVHASAVKDYFLLGWEATDNADPVPASPPRACTPKIMSEAEPPSPPEPPATICSSRSRSVLGPVIVGAVGASISAMYLY